MSQVKTRSELLTGFFVLIGLVSLGGLIIKFGSFSDRFSDQYMIYATFDDAAGLVQGSEVRMGGTKIGSITQPPELTEDLQARVSMGIRSNVVIAEGSVFTISSIGLLGDKMVQVIPPNGDRSQRIMADEEVEGRNGGGLESLQTDANQAIKKATIALDQISMTAETLELTLREVQSSASMLNEKFLNEKNSESLTGVLTNLEKLSEKLNDASVELKPTLVQARSTLTSLENTSDNARITFSRIDSQLDTLKPAINEIPPAIRSLAETSRKAGKAIDKLDNKNGLLSTITKDKSVAADTKVFIKNLKRYGILRYRDDKTDPPEDPRDRFQGRRR